MVAPAPRHIDLEPFAPVDFARLLSWVPDEVAMICWAGSIFEWPLTETQLEAYLAPTEEHPPTRLVWKALDVASGEAVGHVELNSIDSRHGSTTLSRVLIGPPHRGRGLSRAMVAAVLPVAFDDFGLHRVDLRVFEDNEPARCCYESLGFMREGRLREVSLINGEFVDSLVMSLLEDEWRRRG
jgi:RimJ/RimL family protein N-acetyltransferase